MTDQKDDLRRGVNEALFWSYAAPVLMLWSLCGFLPVFGLMIEGAPAAVLAGQAAFLVLGSPGLLGLVVISQFLQPPGPKTLTVQTLLKGKRGILTIYATLWLAAYAAFVYLA